VCEAKYWQYEATFAHSAKSILISSSLTSQTSSRQCVALLCCAEVLPVFLAVIQEHRDAGTRDKLTHALFNLVKKPNTAQRRLIADSCADLAARIGPSRTAEELLPQCWEQVPYWRQSLCSLSASLPQVLTHIDDEQAG